MKQQNKNNTMVAEADLRHTHLNKQLSYARTINRMAVVLASENSPHVILSTMASIIGTALNLDRTLIYQVQHSKNTATGLCEWLNPETPSLLPTLTIFPLAMFKNCLSCIEKEKTFFISHKSKPHNAIVEDQLVETLHHDMQIESLLWYPFAYNDDGFYLLVFNQVSSEQNWDGDELDFINSLVNHVNLALMKINMIEENNAAMAKLKMLGLVVEQSPVSILITDTTGHIEYVNQKFSDISGYSFEEAMGQNPNILKSGQNNENTYTKLWKKIAKGKTWHGELHNKKKNGDLYWEDVQITPITDETGAVVNYLSHKVDITTRKAYEEKLLHQENYDDLTGFPNRLLVLDRLTQALHRAKRKNKKVGILNIDLDDFKKVNDSHSYEAGNQVITEAAHRLNACIRSEDTIARLAGDEFQVIIPDLDSIIDLEQIAQKLLNSFSQTFLINSQEIFMTASIGATIYPDDGGTADILMRNASATVHLAKDRGRNNIRFFTDRLNKQAHDRILLGSHLRHAIERNELTLNYQPIIDLKSGKVQACEVLLRWQNETLGSVPPSTFIPHAEDSGLINPIGEWVLQQSCEQISQWQRAGMKHINFAINTSGRQYRDKGFAHRFIQIVDDYGLAPHSIEFEITESLLLDDAPKLTQMLQQFVDAGINLAIDDFGTGYSSLSYLRRFPLKKLKIDRSFILGLDNEDGRALVRAITMVAHALNLKVVAEGVETDEQITFLRQNNCDLIQGYIYSKPLSAKDFASFVNARK